MGCCAGKDGAGPSGEGKDADRLVGVEVSSTRRWGPRRFLDGLRQRQRAPESSSDPQSEPLSDKQIIALIRKHGRSYAPGEVLITFGELLEHDPGAADKLVRMRDENQLTYDGSQLFPGADDEVFITCVLPGVKGRSTAQPWRGVGGEGRLTPRANETAPAVDIDEGLINYVMIAALTPEGDAALFVRSYSGFGHAGVLELAVDPLAAAGYTAIKCVGGGQMDHQSRKRRLVISGTSQGFGTADHQQTASMCRQRLGDRYAIDVIEPPVVRDPLAHASSEQLRI